MARPYSKDLRERFVAALDEGMSAGAAGARMRIARSTAVRWAAIWRTEGRAEAKPTGGDRRSEELEAHSGAILGWVRERPDLFLSEIAARLAKRKVETSQASVARLLSRHGVTRKKKTLVASEQAREDVSRARSNWREDMAGLDPAGLVFLDESGFDTKMTRGFGRSDRGTPCLGAVPHGRWGNNTFTAGLRVGTTCAPMLMQGAMDGTWFAFWVETQLAPTLRHGDIVVCDNLAVHKNAPARASIEARGAELRFLPAYSPDLNPIEMMFAKIKAMVRSAAPRCFDTLSQAIGDALAAITPDECSNYLRHAGYRST